MGEETSSGGGSSSSPIKTVVVLVQENRSFDHMLGWFKELNPEIDGVSESEPRSNPISTSDPNSAQVFFGKESQNIDPDPGHSFQAIYEQVFGKPFSDESPYPYPKMNGFVQNAEAITKGMSEKVVMQGFPPEKLPVFKELVQEFAVCDRWFSSLPSSTQPNRLYVHAATSNGAFSNDTNTLVRGFPQRTVFESLEESGFTFGIYYQSFPNCLFYRHLAQRFIKCRMGNGKSTWFWHDNWSPLGNLLNHIGEDGPRELRIRRDAKVSDACTREGWRLASPRSDSALSLHIYLSSLSPVSISTEEDCFEWIVDDKPCDGFSASKTWEVLRERDSEKTWAELVWFKGCTPKHAFHMWISNMDRLPTRSKLAAWGIQVPSTCCLCNAALETRDHLFLHCGFSKEIWDKVMHRLDIQPFIFDDWESMMAWGKISSIRQPQTLRLLLIHAVVYNIWRQRNNLIHNQVTIPPLLIFKDIDRQIINSITARRTMKRFRKLMQLWLR